MSMTISPTPPRTLLLLCYSVSQARVIKAFIERVPKPAQLTVVSFNDTAAVNETIAQELSELPVDFMVFAEFAAQNQLAVQSSAQAPGRVLFEHPYTDMLLGQVQAAHRLLEALKPDLVLVVEDGPGGCDPIIKAANQSSIPVAIMPFGVGEDRDYEIFLAQKHEEGTLNIVPDGPIGDVLRSHAAKWIRKTSYGDITLFPAEFVLARLSAGLDLPNPWLVQGGTADMLMVESEAMRRIYSREGVPASKQILVGSIYADIIHDELQRSMITCAEDTQTSASPKILLSLPPSYHAEKSRVTEFDTYQQTIEKMILEIKQSAPHSDLVVSLHPAAAPDTLDVIKSFGVKVSDRWILEDIARNDIFINTFSSTTRWALGAKRFVLNYDMYNFALPTYETVPNFFSCTLIVELGAQLRGIVNKESSVMERYRETFEKADEWAIMDGQNFKRIWAYLNSLMDGSTERG